LDSVSFAEPYGEVSLRERVCDNALAAIYPLKWTFVSNWNSSIHAGFKTPQTAIEGTYIDKKCPFTGDVAIRGRIFK